MPIYLPCEHETQDNKEQEKIAACLSSVDNLISTKQTKLESLKKYKKGLLQQLFPQGNNDLPALRFPEFKILREWTKKSLQKITKINQGLQIPISERYTEKVGNSYFYITNEFLKENSNNKYFIKNPPQSVICHEDDILMTRTGNTGQVVTNVSGAFHNNFFKIKYTTEVNKDFLVYFLKLPQTQNLIMRYAGTSTIPDLNHNDFYRLEINLPNPAEQKKIADCLTSLDNLIELKQQELDKLSRYKKGLLQQLLVQG